MPKRIGITAGEIDNRADLWSPMTYGQSYTYSDAIINAEGVPYIMPLTPNSKALRTIYDNLDGILFAGGNDVNPRLYGQEPYEQTKDVSEFRDEVEVQLLQWCLEDGKPVLALCRGMQLVNVVCGGTLYQDIPSDLPESADHEIATQESTKDRLVHQLRIEPSSKLTEILESDTIGANTHHHQAVDQIAPGFVAVAWSEDEIIEAIERPNDANYLMALQCHPESLEAVAEPRWQKLFKSFVDAC
jgi:putative glutamine amidotransferase